ncbi:XRE family transcriptional regulator [Bradyrhizobium liaoningense]|uniref:helix-turn-helix domain-containing protein n=1 Tax=Bradyrhizobium liaoningense TaxID=43992 RepID=UPI001BA95C8F|nr:XRE family transcriptional regulator [Bradyrhizobium liaoningense]MBR0841739.1 XRE family transcriptional regulator [Bradyrhizobium liaoningense]
MTTRHTTLRKTALGTIGSGNVFADLGFPEPEIELAKANLVIKIDETIEKRGLTYARASKLMEMPRQELTRLLHGHTGPYTVERLKEFLSRLSP